MIVLCHEGPIVMCVQVMSKSCACKFLHGTETNREEIRKLDDALNAHTEFKTEIIFYRKHGNNHKRVIFQ